MTRQVLGPCPGTGRGGHTVVGASGQRSQQAGCDPQPRAPPADSAVSGTRVCASFALRDTPGPPGGGSGARVGGRPPSAVPGAACPPDPTAQRTPGGRTRGTLFALRLDQQGPQGVRVHTQHTQHTPGSTRPGQAFTARDPFWDCSRCGTRTPAVAIRTTGSAHVSSRPRTVGRTPSPFGTRTGRPQPEGPPWGRVAGASPGAGGTCLWLPASL